MYHGIRVALLALLGLLLVACSSAPGPRPESRAAPAAAAPTGKPVIEVGAVSLRRQSPDIAALDLGIVVFDRGLDAAAVQRGELFPELRKAESILLPVALAGAIAESGFWGAVRVVHAPLDSMPLQLTGEIIRADGEVLELDLALRSASGEVLLARRYRDRATDADYPVTAGDSPFADLYRAVSNDLAEVAERLDGAGRRDLARLALMNFARRLSPAAFDDYVAEEGGRLALQKYPADGDPMLARLQRLRRQEYLFIDTVDERYRDLNDEVGPSYALWQQYSRELALYGSEYREFVAGRDRAGRRGSFAAMQQVYGSFRKVKLQEEDLRDLVEGFVGESLETVLEVDDGVVRLDGTVEERYDRWRELLAEIYRLETGT